MRSVVTSIEDRCEVRCFVLGRIPPHFRIPNPYSRFPIPYSRFPIPIYPIPDFCFLNPLQRFALKPIGYRLTTYLPIDHYISLIVSQTAFHLPIPIKVTCTVSYSLVLLLFTVTMISYCVCVCRCVPDLVYR